MTTSDKASGETALFYLWFCIFTVAALIVLLAGVSYALGLEKMHNEVQYADKNSALEAVKLMKDWGVWMASIQTATLAALGILAKEGALSLKPSRTTVCLILVTAICNASALFFSAWLLTSLSSVALHLVGPEFRPAGMTYDFYNLPLWNFANGSRLGDLVTVGYIAACNHWLWAIGILSFGCLTISIAISRASAPPQGTPAPVFLCLGQDGQIKIELAGVSVKP